MTFGWYSDGVLNRKFADLRHAPELDPRVLRYDPALSPQAVVSIGPGATTKTKGGVIMAEPGFIWALFLFPDRWYAITSIYDARGALVAHHVDLCRPPEERDGMLSFVDLKLDLLMRPDGKWSWLDEDDYQREIEAGTIPDVWREAVAQAVAALEQDCRAQVFPPAVVERYRPGMPISS